GRFFFPDLPPGEYRIVASQDGFVYSTRGSQVTVVSGRKTDFSVGILPDGAVSGRVVDWDGIPVVGIQVQALTFKQDARGRRTLTVVKSTQTNDLGEYRLYWLPPGPYLVSADTTVSGDATMANVIGLLQGQRLMNLQLIPTYFPNAVDATGATRIDVKPGETFTGAGIRLIDLRKRSISGAVSIASIRGSTVVDLTPRNLASGLRPQTTSANSNGIFRFANIIPGSYVLTAEATNADGLETFGSMSIDIGNRDIENLSIAMNTGFDLRIRLTIEGRPRRTDDPQLVVNLRPLISETPFPTVEPSGNDELLMRHVMVGDYSVGVLSLRTSLNVSVSPSN
ncbi:MAG TPA: carboxypeptidase-like regulatory domain-containing protein, partial [Terriglobia bacterium]|nr:carboxypeptidase-like regulatory domain-containing protein [Terriglobia bacterium]